MVADVVEFGTRVVLKSMRPSAGGGGRWRLVEFGTWEVLKSMRPSAVRHRRLVEFRTRVVQEPMRPPPAYSA